MVCHPALFEIRSWHCKWRWRWRLVNLSSVVADIFKIFLKSFNYKHNDNMTTKYILIMLNAWQISMIIEPLKFEHYTEFPMWSCIVYNKLLYNYRIVVIPSNTTIIDKFMLSLKFTSETIFCVPHLAHIQLVYHL